jgi:hypothetical protein
VAEGEVIVGTNYRSYFGYDTRYPGAIASTKMRHYIRDGYRLVRKNDIIVLIQVRVDMGVMKRNRKPGNHSLYMIPMHTNSTASEWKFLCIPCRSYSKWIAAVSHHSLKHMQLRSCRARLFLSSYLQLDHLQSYPSARSCLLHTRLFGELNVFLDIRHGYCRLVDRDRRLEVPQC